MYNLSANIVIPGKKRRSFLLNNVYSTDLTNFMRAIKGCLWNIL
jgi:hypothetical protein